MKGKSRECWGYSLQFKARIEEKKYTSLAMPIIERQLCKFDERHKIPCEKSIHKNYHGLKKRRYPHAGDLHLYLKKNKTKNEKENLH